MLERAFDAKRSRKTDIAIVVILRREDECRQPSTSVSFILPLLPGISVEKRVGEGDIQVGKDKVNRDDKLAQHGFERRHEGRNEEKDRQDGDD